MENDRRDKGDLIIRIVLQPSKELRNAIDLIIVATVGKRQKLQDKIIQPRCAVRQVDVTGLNLRRLGRHAVHFTAFRFDVDWTRHSLRHGGSEILQKVHAGARVLDQDCGRAMLRGQSDDLAAQVRIFEALPVDMNEVGLILVEEPCGALPKNFGFSKKTLNIVGKAVTYLDAFLELSATYTVSALEMRNR